MERLYETDVGEKLFLPRSAVQMIRLFSVQEPNNKKCILRVIVAWNSLKYQRLAPPLLFVHS
jgi:hypothetical protein